MKDGKYMRIQKYKVAYKTDERLDNEKPGWIISEPFTLYSLQLGGDTTQFDFSDGSYLGTDDVDWEKELTWLEWTGLKDKNGKEIYEGDILKHDLWGISQVIWEHGMFRGQSPEDTHDVTMADHQLARTRVIGNVWEHPELLKEGK